MQYMELFLFCKGVELDPGTVVVWADVEVIRLLVEDVGIMVVDEVCFVWVLTEELVQVGKVMYNNAAARSVNIVA